MPPEPAADTDFPPLPAAADPARPSPTTPSSPLPRPDTPGTPSSACRNSLTRPVDQEVCVHRRRGSGRKLLDQLDWSGWGQPMLARKSL
ncbi:hypothetical protein C1I93_29650 [Micromonospora endophytica]|uniref:Uncharacterized protein n=1 Tax=Micromonospora endophytica TaxID=515350 RepID=A0A2W2CV45_9ACTN|nr:hypothetical protein C1I93_29650 [Micromonospora endophytica]